MDYEGLLELVKNRRSVRRFLTDPIPDEYVEKIIEAACWAPSGFNLQPWEFVVVKKQELKDSIVQAITNYSRAHYPGIELAREAGTRQEICLADREGTEQDSVRLPLISPARHAVALLSNKRTWEAVYTSVMDVRGSSADVTALLQNVH